MADGIGWMGHRSIFPLPLAISHEPWSASWFRYYYSDRLPLPSRRRQVRLACELDLPLVIHTREADEDTIRILREEGGGRLRGVLHCFTGGPSLADAGLALGFYISLAGIITFPKAAELRETVRRVPTDRVLTETDSPFLAPVPHRGQRNEPARVVHIVDALANLHGLERADLAARTQANFYGLIQ